MKKSIIALAIGLAVSGAASASDRFGVSVDESLNANSKHYFGFEKPIGASETVTVPRAHGQKGHDLIKLAKGLTAQIVTRKSAQNSDQIAFWPNDTTPSHIVTCVEDFRDPADNILGQYPSGTTKYGPSVQRVNLKTGAVETILRGLSSCDGIRRTPWNTIVVTEERDDGGLYEILNPLNTTELTVVARGASDTIDSAGKPVTGKVEYRPAVGNLAWEGLDFTKQGVLYYGDELRPGTAGPDADGGSLFKFVPSTTWNGAPVTDLSTSPLIAGNVYAFQASCVAKTSGSFPQFGQGCEIGEGAWLKADAGQLRASVAVISATGYYRPEDGHLDPSYTGSGAKFCWNNTGNEDAKNYGETFCLVDTNPVGTGEQTVDNPDSPTFGLTYLADSKETKGFAVAVANRLLEGDTDFNQPDNLAFQPVTGKMYVVEDHPFGDIWACLADSVDRDTKSDGCVKALSVRDSSAEPTGFIFSGDGKSAYVHIQHSSDSACAAGTDCADNDGYPTDDLVKITGFRAVKN